MKNYFVHRLHNMGSSANPVEPTDDQPADNTIQPLPRLVHDEEETPCTGNDDCYREAEDDSDDNVESRNGDVADDEYYETNVFDIAETTDNSTPLQNSGVERGFRIAPLYSVSIAEDSTASNSAGANTKKKNQYIKKPVYLSSHFWFRGKGLAILTMFKYAALVDVVPKSRDKKQCSITEEGPDDPADDATISENQDDGTPTGGPIDKAGDATTTKAGDNNANTNPHSQGHNRRSPGHPKRKTFPFHPNNPLYESHTQVLRAKQPTLIFNAYPPKYPGPGQPGRDDQELRLLPAGREGHDQDEHHPQEAGGQCSQVQAQHPGIPWGMDDVPFSPGITSKSRCMPQVTPITPPSSGTSVTASPSPSVTSPGTSRSPGRTFRRTPRSGSTPRSLSQQTRRGSPCHESKQGSGPRTINLRLPLEDQVQATLEPSHR
jgi:hypothetical protein